MADFFGIRRHGNGCAVGVGLSGLFAVHDPLNGVVVDGPLGVEDHVGRNRFAEIPCIGAGSIGIPAAEGVAGGSGGGGSGNGSAHTDRLRRGCCAVAIGMERNGGILNGCGSAGVGDLTDSVPEADNAAGRHIEPGQGQSGVHTFHGGGHIGAVDVGSLIAGAGSFVIGIDLSSIVLAKPEAAGRGIGGRNDDKGGIALLGSGCGCGADHGDMM